LLIVSKIANETLSSQTARTYQKHKPLKKELVDRILSHQEGEGGGGSSTPTLAVDCIQYLENGEELGTESDDEDEEVVNKE
jgi:hypothetical protein